MSSSRRSPFALKRKKTRKPVGSSRSPILPLAALGLLAAVILAGLIYWGLEGSRQEGVTRLAASPQTPAGKETARPAPTASQANQKPPAKDPVTPPPQQPAQNGARKDAPPLLKEQDPPRTGPKTREGLEERNNTVDGRKPPTPPVSMKGGHSESPSPAAAGRPRKDDTLAARTDSPEKREDFISSHEKKRVESVTGGTLAEVKQEEKPGEASSAPAVPWAENAGEKTGGHGAAEPKSPPPTAPREKELLASLHTGETKKHKIPKPAPPMPELLPPVGRVAIIIDDFGQDLQIAREFLKIPLSITFSILPHQRHTREIARLAHSRGREVLLHVPMEPMGYPTVNPGKGALLLSMKEAQIRKSLRTALDASPHFRGANNHMGSRFTTDEAAMKLVLGEIGRRGMFFLDSHTTADSVVVPVAEKLRVPTGQRDIFLDHVQTEQFVRSQLDELIATARATGAAIAIGHPYECTLKVLREYVERFAKERIAVVPCGELMTGLPRARSK